MDLLERIKELARSWALDFTQKAFFEMERDGLSPDDVRESILCSSSVRSKRSTSSQRRGRREKIHVIEGFTLSGVLVYTKGVIRRLGDQETFFVLVSAKRSVRGGAA